MVYPEEIVEEIRQKSDIVDVISSYVKIQKKGSSHFGLCPFHNEKSPSFSVSQVKQMYYCFGCGVGGNVFTFVMQYENYTFQEAVKFLAQRAGVELPEMEYNDDMRKKENRRQQLLQANKDAATFYFYQLRQERGKIGYEYLRKRELSEETIKKFGLGYAPLSSNGLVAFLKSKGHSDDLILEAGLGSHDERQGIYDKFYNRVMFPIQDINHRVIGFGGRVLGDGSPKYLNTMETPVFDKSRNLYGLNFARTSRKNNVILCEGYMDVIALHQAGFIQAVAALGTSFTPGQANLIRRYSEEVLICFDSDEAGKKAALRAIQILKEVELSAKVILLKPYKDPDEFIKNLGEKAFQERIDHAENSFFFEISVLQEAYDLKDPEDKTKFHKEIAKKLCGFTVDLERDNYLEAIAEKYQIGFENLRKLVQGYAAATGGVAPVNRPKSGMLSKKSSEEMAEDAKKRSQRLLLTWLSEEPQLYHRIKKYIGFEDFTNPLYQKVAEKLFEGIEESTIHPAAIISMFADEGEQKEVAALFNTKLEDLETDQDKQKAFHHIVVNVKTASFEESSRKLGSDVMALNKVIQGKKALEELQKTQILID